MYKLDSGYLLSCFMCVLEGSVFVMSLLHDPKTSPEMLFAIEALVAMGED